MKNNNPLLISYYTLRQSIGWLGISLPVILILGNALACDCNSIQKSISQYYYTIMGDVMVGILCSVAVFMFTYKGYDKTDKLVTNLAGLFALGIALSPTNYDLIGCGVRHYQVNAIRDITHSVSASLFFLSTAFMSFFQFTKNTEGEIMTPKKIIRNKIFRVCAGSIVISLIMCLLTVLLKLLPEFKLFFLFECLALFSFGVSWLVKGEIILKDEA